MFAVRRKATECKNCSFEHLEIRVCNVYYNGHMTQDVHAMYLGLSILGQSIYVLSVILTPL